jgi:hypothetical protein
MFSCFGIDNTETTNEETATLTTPTSTAPTPTPTSTPASTSTTPTTMVGAIRAFLFTTMAAVAAAISIYPEDHWNYSTQLTESNFESFIQEQIDQDKTTFVRWIASSGW